MQLFDIRFEEISKFKHILELNIDKILSGCKIFSLNLPYRETLNKSQDNLTNSCIKVIK